MLNATNLNNLLTALQTAIPEIDNIFAVVSDDDVANYAREIGEAEINLIGVLPSFTMNGRDEDALRHNNRMLLFVVIKQALREGESGFLSLFDTSGAVTIKILSQLKVFKTQFPQDCLYKDINLTGIVVDPVREYHNMSGYMIDFDLLN